MKIKPLHEWKLPPKQAIELQKQLAFEIVVEDKFDEPVKTVAGIDRGYDVNSNISRAVVVVLKFPELELIAGSENAVKYVLACAPKYRLPETTRLADKMASYRKI